MNYNLTNTDYILGEIIGITEITDTSSSICIKDHEGTIQFIDGTIQGEKENQVECLVNKINGELMAWLNISQTTKTQTVGENIHLLPSEQGKRISSNERENNEVKKDLIAKLLFDDEHLSIMEKFEFIEENKVDMHIEGLPLYKEILNPLDIKTRHYMHDYYDANYENMRNIIQLYHYLCSLLTLGINNSQEQQKECYRKFENDIKRFPYGYMQENEFLTKVGELKNLINY